MFHETRELEFSFVAQSHSDTVDAAAGMKKNVVNSGTFKY